MFNHRVIENTENSFYFFSLRAQWLMVNFIHFSAFLKFIIDVGVFVIIAGFSAFQSTNLEINQNKYTGVSI